MIMTSGQRHLTTGRIAAAHGLTVFARWRQCASPHASLTYLSPNPKGHLNRFSRFWATVCKTVHPMLRDRCPVCLSVCNVGVLWPNGWMDQDATWYGGRPRPMRHCVRWGPSSSPRKWPQQTPLIRPMSILAKRSPISATAELLLHSSWQRVAIVYFKTASPFPP